ncbi:sulfite exporter TauE/SafE family protein [Natrialba swarupiae]|nr:sulfite exporter TauE/SafE family protein [Natrialba swarupiae]
MSARAVENDFGTGSTPIGVVIPARKQSFDASASRFDGHFVRLPGQIRIVSRRRVGFCRNTIYYIDERRTIHRGNSRSCRRGRFRLPDVGFKTAIGFYTGILAGVLAGGGVLAGVATPTLLSMFPTAVTVTTIVGFVLAGRATGLAERIGERRWRRLACYAPAAAFGAVVPISAATSIDLPSRFRPRRHVVRSHGRPRVRRRPHGTKPLRCVSNARRAHRHLVVPEALRSFE